MSDDKRHALKLELIELNRQLQDLQCYHRVRVFDVSHFSRLAEDSRRDINIMKVKIEDMVKKLERKEPE